MTTLATLRRRRLDRRAVAAEHSLRPAGWPARLRALVREVGELERERTKPLRS